MTTNLFKLYENSRLKFGDITGNILNLFFGLASQLVGPPVKFVQSCRIRQRHNIQRDYHILKKFSYLRFVTHLELSQIQRSPS